MFNFFEISDKFLQTILDIYTIFDLFYGLICLVNYLLFYFLDFLCEEIHMEPEIGKHFFLLLYYLLYLELAFAKLLFWRRFFNFRVWLCNHFLLLLSFFKDGNDYMVLPTFLLLFLFLLTIGLLIQTQLHMLQKLLHRYNIMTPMITTLTKNTDRTTCLAFFIQTY